MKLSSLGMMAEKDLILIWIRLCPILWLKSMLKMSKAVFWIQDDLGLWNEAKLIEPIGQKHGWSFHNNSWETVLRFQELCVPTSCPWILIGEFNFYSHMKKEEVGQALFQLHVKIILQILNYGDAESTAIF